MKRKKVKLLCLVAALCVCMAVTYIAYAQAGSEDDPVISLSYLQQIFKPEIKQETSFKVVSVARGERILGSDGTEMILRMGSADVIATSKGGLCDATAGADLSDATAAPSNHLLIVPVSDGRGLKAASDCLVMVKGGYEIK